MAGTRTRALKHGPDAARDCNVIVFDQHRVVETEAVVEAAAAAHGVFLERAQARRGLARAADASARAFDAADELVRCCRNAGEMAEQIERDALGCQHRTSRPCHMHQRRLCGDARAIACKRGDRDLGRELAEGGGDQRQARDHARFARDHDRMRGGIFRNGRDRGHVARATEIFGQRARDDIVDLERRQEGIGAEQRLRHGMSSGGN